MRISTRITRKYLPWNKDRLIGQKLPLTLKQIWTIRMSLQSTGKVRDLAMFNLAIDSKLRACDLLRIKVSDICSDGLVNGRATVVQQKTRRPVKFEITDRTKRSIEKWVQTASLGVSDCLFPSRQKVRLICLCASTRESCLPGSPKSDSTPRSTERIRCEGPSRP